MRQHCRHTTSEDSISHRQEWKKNWCPRAHMCVRVAQWQAQLALRMRGRCCDLLIKPHKRLSENARTTREWVYSWSQSLLLVPHWDLLGNRVARCVGRVLQHTLNLQYTFTKQEQPSDETLSPGPYITREYTSAESMLLQALPPCTPPTAVGT
jgi:hypothetical protein